MLTATNLTYAYPNTERAALRGVSLALDVGDILLVAGGTGSGKSTLCFALSGFVPHFFNGDIEGDVTMDGRSMRGAKLGEWVQEVGLVLQNPFNQLSGARMTVFGEVAFGLENLGVPRDEMGPRVHAVLEQLEIAHLAERSPFALSGGQMQRVAIASILVLQPRLLVLDEPTAQLDPVGTREVFDVLRALAGQGTTVVLVTHQLAEAAELATRAIVLHEGSIVAEGDTRTVLSDPRLPGWRVEPPVYVPLAARLGLPAPLPVTFEQAEGAF
ncbi:MAG TPA: ABC transporter ATP-binding protein, partial [Ardenticatenaceae bacterium]